MPQALPSDVFQQLREAGHLGEQAASVETPFRQSSGGPTEVRPPAVGVGLFRNSGSVFIFKTRGTPPKHFY